MGLAETLVSMGHEMDIVTSGMAGLPVEEEVNGVHIHRVRCLRRHRHYVTNFGMLTQVVPAYKKALRLVTRNAYALNHTHFVVPTGIASYMLWKRTGLPYVITAHGSDIPGYNPDRFRATHVLIRPMWKRIVENAAGIVTPSHFLTGLLNESLEMPTDVIPNGIDFPQPTNGSKKNRLLIVTRMFERKGVQFFLKALGSLRTDWEVCIAGDGPYLPHLKKLASRISAPVDFLGFVRGPDLTKLYHSAKIFVFPSLMENFPVVLLEAMNSGCAVITTTAKGCAEVVEDAAVKVAPGSVSELSTAMARLIDDDGEISRLSRLAQERVAQFSSRNVALQYEELFRRFAR
jgi:glycosyltransferase involved in cell wall biosynthesis